MFLFSILVFYCFLFYLNDSGGITLQYQDNIYIAPSGVQKERIQGHHLYIFNKQQQILKEPSPSLGLKPSQCTPLFFNAYELRSAKACIHTHSQNAVLVTLLFDKEFKMTHQEMIKGIQKGSTSDYYQYHDELVVPIIENTAHERDLKESMREVCFSFLYKSFFLKV
jgi:methylthioribulose-1-phosphate dehydratase